jgi:hypothetical protein
MNGDDPGSDSRPLSCECSHAISPLSFQGAKQRGTCFAGVGTGLTPIHAERTRLPVSAYSVYATPSEDSHPYVVTRGDSSPERS